MAEDIRSTIIEQLLQMQVIMHRISYHTNKKCSSYRGQGRILSLLSSSTELTQKELGRQLDISKQSLTELLLKLEKSGHIVREHSKCDRRIMTVSLTPEGRKLAAAAEESRESLPEMLECLDENELAALKSYLDRIISCAGRKQASGQEDACVRCAGPENCSRDYLKYGHDRPSPRYCKYVRGTSTPQGEK